MGEWAFPRCFPVRNPPARSPMLLRLLFPVPWERGGRRRPARGGGEKRLCRRRLKRRRCESSGLRAPFLCAETESGSEGSRRFAYPVPGVPRSLTAFGFIPEEFRSWGYLYITYAFSLPFLCGRSLTDPGIEEMFQCFGEWVFSSCPISSWGGWER